MIDESGQRMGHPVLNGCPHVSCEVERLDAEEFGGLAELFLDAEELVVLGDAVGAAGRAGLDLAGAGGDREVGDEGVFGLAGAVADDGGVAVAAAELDGLEGLGDGADLVELDQDGVGDLLLDALLQALGVGDEEVVADELDVAELLGEELPAVPVVLGEAVFERDDGVLA